MGSRTVVILNNDYNWTADKDLGNKIQLRMGRLKDLPNGSQGITVTEVQHADTVTLAKISFYGKFEVMGYSNWENVNQDVWLLKEMAEKLGYKIVKKK